MKFNVRLLIRLSFSLSAPRIHFADLVECADHVDSADQFGMFIRFIFSSLRSLFEIALIVLIALTVLIMLFVKDELYLYACIY